MIERALLIGAGFLVAFDNIEGAWIGATRERENILRHRWMLGFASGYCVFVLVHLMFIFDDSAAGSLVPAVAGGLGAGAATAIKPTTIALIEGRYDTEASQLNTSYGKFNAYVFPVAFAFLAALMMQDVQSDDPRPALNMGLPVMWSGLLQVYPLRKGGPLVNWLPKIAGLVVIVATVFALF